MLIHYTLVVSQSNCLSGPFSSVIDRTQKRCFCQNPSKKRGGSWLVKLTPLQGPLGILSEPWVRAKRLCVWQIYLSISDMDCELKFKSTPCLASSDLIVEIPSLTACTTLSAAPTVSWPCGGHFSTTEFIEEVAPVTSWKTPHFQSRWQVGWKYHPLQSSRSLSSNIKAVICLLPRPQS